MSAAPARPAARTAGALDSAERLDTDSDPEGRRALEVQQALCSPRRCAGVNAPGTEAARYVATLAQVSGQLKTSLRFTPELGLHAVRLTLRDLVRYLQFCGFQARCATVLVRMQMVQHVQSAEL